MWPTVSQVQGGLNVEADVMSRKFNDSTEWKLDTKLFHKLVDIIGKPEIDLFASHLNNQHQPFESWSPDPEAFAVDGQISIRVPFHPLV